MIKGNFTAVLWDVTKKEAEELFPVRGAVPSLADSLCCPRDDGSAGHPNYQTKGRNLFLLYSFCCLYFLVKSEVLMEYWLLGKLT